MRTRAKAQAGVVVFGWAQLWAVPGWSPLRNARWSAGLSQDELARLIGTTRGTISSLERCQSLPSVTLALALARALDATVEELFAGDDLR